MCATKNTRVKIRVYYWDRSTPRMGTARTYAGAMRIAARNQNAFRPTFWEGGRELIDDGHGLVYEDTIASGRLVYAV